jgi:hypothetical protein
LELDTPSNFFEILKSKNKLRLTERWCQVSISVDKTTSQRDHKRQQRLELSKRKDNGENNWITKYNKGTPYLAQKKRIHR